MPESSKKLLFLPFPLLSHYLRLLEICKMLDQYVSKEHIVFFHVPAYAPFVHAHGYRLTRPVDRLFGEVLTSARQFDFRWINKKTISHVIDVLISVIEEEKPDILVSDTFLGARVVSQHLQISHIAVLNAYVTNYYAYLRDVPHNHKALRFKKYMSEQKWQRIVRLMEDLTLRKVHQPFRAIRKDFSLEPMNNLFDEFTGDVNLLVDDPVIFPLRYIPKGFYFVGPIIYNCVSQNEELDLFLSHQQQKSVIYVTSGSSGKNIIPDFINPAEFSDFVFVIAGHDAVVQQHFENVFTCRFVPFHQIVSRLALVICHGGNGTIYQALHAQKPVIAVPWMFEQEWNVQRFSELNLCKVWYPDSQPELLCQMVRKILYEGEDSSRQQFFKPSMIEQSELIKKIFLAFCYE